MSSPKYIQCRACLKKQARNSPPGFYKTKTQKNGIDYEVLVECTCRKAWRMEKERWDRFISGGFNKDFFETIMYTDNAVDYKGLNSIHNVMRLKMYIDKFHEDDQVRATILYFHGGIDTQKTVTAHWIANRLTWKYDVQYTKLDKFLDNYLTYLYHQDEEEFLKEQTRAIKHENCDLLIIDDFHDNLTDKQAPIIEKFIKSRIDDGLGIIFISRIPLDKFKLKSIKELIHKQTHRRQSEMEWRDIYGDVPQTLF